MRILSWNVRGLGKKARKRQVRDYVTKEKIDIVGLQETMKQDFTDHDLHELAGGANLIWFWLPATRNLEVSYLESIMIRWKWRNM